MQNLKVIENELVPVYTTDKGEKVVYGTELHYVLNVGRDFSTWIKNRLSECDAIEKEDYQSLPQNGGKPQGGRPTIEYIIKLDTAKEMAMLERNDKGKQVRRYFIRVEKKYKENVTPDKRVSFKEQVECIGVVADILRVNDASKIMMLGELYKSYELPTDFLPKYEYNDSREMKSATDLLKRFDLGMSAIKFNEHMIGRGFLEERTRKSTSNKGKEKKYKALTEKGLKYGENAVSPQCQREVQPMYYADTFCELFDLAVNMEVA